MVSPPNPSLIAKSGRKMAEVIAEICAITPGPVSCRGHRHRVRRACWPKAGILPRIAPNVALKVPLTEAGLLHLPGPHRLRAPW